MKIMAGRFSGSLFFHWKDGKMQLSDKSAGDVPIIISDNTLDLADMKLSFDKFNVNSVGTPTCLSDGDIRIPDIRIKTNRNRIRHDIKVHGDMYSSSKLNKARLIDPDGYIYSSEEGKLISRSSTSWIRSASIESTTIYDTANQLNNILRMMVSSTSTKYVNIICDLVRKQIANISIVMDRIVTPDMLSNSIKIDESKDDKNKSVRPYLVAYTLPNGDARLAFYPDLVSDKIKRMLETVLVKEGGILRQSITPSREIDVPILIECNINGQKDLLPAIDIYNICTYLLGILRGTKSTYLCFTETAKFLNEIDEKDTATWITDNIKQVHETNNKMEGYIHDLLVSSTSDMFANLVKEEMLNKAIGPVTSVIETKATNSAKPMIAGIKDKLLMPEKATTSEEEEDDYDDIENNTEDTPEEGEE